MTIAPFYKTKESELYNCDNSRLLKQIESNSVNLIYCDILYGTGRNFGDYQDLKAERKVIEEHYVPRIAEMKRVLKNNGSIFLQMDFKISHWVRVIMDDVFGYENIRNEIIWKYGLGRSSDKQFGKRHDNIYWYSNSENYTYNKQLEKSTSAMMGGAMKNMSDVWTDIPSLNNMAKERIGYETQKNTELLKRIILASSNEGDLVADFYMGSGTTAEVALKNGRRFMGCDIGEKACLITEKRVEKYDKSNLLYHSEE